jgi:triosephosphate isomerase
MKTVFTNWKMNKTVEEAVSFFQRLVSEFGDACGEDIPVVIMCIPSVFIHPVAPMVRGTCLFVGAENMHDREWGAYTGEESAPMLRSAGATHVLLGHSERRYQCGETDESVHRKVTLARAHGLVPIICIGETREEKSAGKVRAVLEKQVRVCLDGVGTDSPCYIAYEPRWAIGAGVTPTLDEIAESHGYIREKVRSIFGAELARHVQLLYGGSVNDRNSYDLCRTADVDGVGLGGCSLDFDCLARSLRDVKRVMNDG